MAEGSEKIIFEVVWEAAKKGFDKIVNGLFGVTEAAKQSGDAMDESISKSIKGINLESKSIKELNDILAKHKKAQGEAFKGGNDDEYRRLKSEIDAIEEALRKKKKAENEDAQATAQNAQNMGSMRKQLKNATMELAQLTMAYRNLSEAEQKGAKGDALLRRMQGLTQEAGALRDSLDDASQAIKNTASDTSTFDAISQGLNVATSAAGAYVGVLGMLGASEEEQQAIQTKLQASLAISNALSVVQNALQEQSALMLGVQSVQAKAAAAAIAIKTAAEGKSVVVTKAATIAQAAFNAVAKANPYILLATALITVVGAITAFALGTKKAKDVTEAQNKELERQQSYMQDFGNAAGKAHAKYMLLVSAYSKLKSTAEKTDFIKKNADAFTELGLRVQNLTDAENVLRKNTQQVIASFAARAQAAAAASAIEKAYTDYYNNLQELNKGEEMTKTVFASRNRNDYDANQQATINNQEKEAKAYIEQRKKAIQDELDKAVKFYQKAFEDANNELSKFNFFDDGKGGATTAKTDNSDKIKALQDYIAKARYSAEMAAKDAQVKAMQDGEAKVLAQMAQDHQKELDEIDRNKAEYVAKQKELAGLQGKSYNESEDPTIEHFLTQIKKVNEAYEASTKKVKAQTQTAINEFLAENGTYTDKVVAIMALYEEKMKGANNAEKMQLANEMQERLRAARSAYGDNLQDVSDEGLTSLLSSLKQLININKDAFNTKQLEAYRDEIAAIENEIANRKPVTSLRKAEEEYDTATSNRQKAERNMFTANDDVAKAQKALNQAENGTYKDDETKIKAVTAAQNALNQAKAKAITASKNYQNACQREIDAEQKVKRVKEQTLESINKLVSAVGQVGSVIGGTVGEITSIVETIGMTVVSSIEGMETAAQAGSEAIKTVERASVILAIISAAIQVAQQIASLLNNDDDKEKNIKSYQRQINALQNAYKDLEKRVEKTYSSEKQANIELQIANKQKQISLIYRQIDEERDKKDSDGDKIASWQQNILDLQRDIKDLKEAAKDAIFGEDINTAIENFADAYVSAWEQGVSRVKSVKDVVRNTMKQMVKLSIESAIQASGSMEKIRNTLADYMADGILDAFEQNAVEQMAVKLEREIENKFGWANNLLKSKSSTEGSSGGFATMSQDSADELNGRFTAFQMSANSIDIAVREINAQSKAQIEHLSHIREYSEEQKNLSLEAVDYLSKIERNTAQLYETNERLSAIERKL